MATRPRQEVGPGAAAPDGARQRRGLPGSGLIKGLSVTLKHMLQRSITQEYPDEKPNLPPRTRGVIALKEENCTVCWKCSRECPDWCIYIESHKETHPREHFQQTVQFSCLRAITPRLRGGRF